jgi:hypothetical protein
MGQDWFPYQARTFPTPPFPEYGSGHSTFRAAGAPMLRLYTGSATFGYSVSFRAGSSKVESGAVPATDVTLRWATFREAPDRAGMARRGVAGSISSKATWTPEPPGGWSPSRRGQGAVLFQRHDPGGLSRWAPGVDPQPDRPSRFTSARDCGSVSCCGRLVR